MRFLLALRLLKVVIAAFWAIALLIVGFAALMHTSGTIFTLSGLAFVAAGEFVLMIWVADSICPKASSLYTDFLKLSAALTFLLTLAGAAAMTALHSI